MYLTRGCQLDLLARSLTLLKANFLPTNPADVFIYHECDADSKELARCAAIVGAKTFLVDFSSVPEAAKDVPRKGLGYRHMCHFFANDIFLRPELTSYEYIMREDVDSFILSSTAENIFDMMRARGAVYGYRGELKDRPHVCVDLWRTADAYFKDNGIVTCAKMYSEIKELGLYYTNFEICKLSFFKGVPWQRFFEAIDKAGGIWKYRWGDAPIRYIGVKALLPAQQIWQVTPLHYEHFFRWRRGSRHREPLRLLHCYWMTAKMLIRGYITRFFNK